MRAPVASLWLACLWLGGSGTSVALGDEPDCVTACIESAIDSFNRCRELGRTLSECLATVEREFTQCSGERGCQRACADGCLAETSSVYASCLADGGSEEECADVARQAAASCYPACPTDCELNCTLLAVLACLSEAYTAGDCMIPAAGELVTCTEECGEPDDKDEDGIPNDFDRCGVTPHVACGTADAGGPYIVAPVTGIQLDGSGSLIPGGTIVDYSWDLNGDGVFGDATGVHSFVSVLQLPGIQRSVFALRVTDDRGLSDTAYAEFTVARPGFSVDDVEVVEGDAGTQEVTLTVRLSQPVASAVTVDFLTRDGAPVSGTLGNPFTWDNCSIRRIIDLYKRGLLVHADGTPPHEGDFPAWPHPESGSEQECRLYHWHNDEAEEIDARKGCGHSFAYQPDRHPHSATAGDDYVARSGTITFEPGQKESEIVVEIIGDTMFEPEESFQVFLRNPSIGSLVDGVGVVTILDGDPRPEDCTDGIDNNGDGLADCDDPTCGVEDGCPQALQAFVRCDANSDGLLDVSDAVHMVSELFLGVPQSTCRETADCNGDTFRDISDVVFILAFTFGGGSAPPLPFPECGTVAQGMGAGGTVDCEVYTACPPPI